MGARSVIVPPARIDGADRIEIGDGVLLHEHAWLMARGSEGVTLRIGDHVTFTRFVKVVAMESVTIGTGAVLADHSYVSDVEYVVGHDDRLPKDRPLTTPAPVVIGPHAFIGLGAVVKPGVTIGAHAYVGAASVVDDDVPEWSLAVGNPAKVIRYFGPDAPLADG